VTLINSLRNAISVGASKLWRAIRKATIAVLEELRRRLTKKLRRHPHWACLLVLFLLSTVVIDPLVQRGTAGIWPQIQTSVHIIFLIGLFVCLILIEPGVWVFRQIKEVAKKYWRFAIVSATFTVTWLLGLPLAILNTIYGGAWRYIAEVGIGILLLALTLEIVILPMTFLGKFRIVRRTINPIKDFFS
jgi:hypothetical protein